MKPRVLITREPERAAELIHLLEADGIEAVAEPVTHTVFLPQDDLPAPESFNWLIFTSVNAVKGFRKAFTSALPALRIAVIGPGTAEETTQLLRQPDYIARQSDAASLGAELLDSFPDLAHETVLWPCASKSSDVLLTQLMAAGAKVMAWPVYRTEPMSPEQLLARLTKRWPWEIALFAAPSAVGGFSGAWPKPWDFPCIAIGSVTAKALTQSGIPDVRISRGPGAADLRNTILETLRPR
jgi:uroporphyrinogen-III synthase